MKLLIIGKTGQLGSQLIKDATSLGYEAVPLHRKFDIEKGGYTNINYLELLDFHLNLSFERILNKTKPDIVINAAAYNDTILAELNKEQSFSCNSIAVGIMSKQCNKFKIPFVTFSTDYVFDGRKNEPYIETDVPSPLQTYGLSKLSGEYASLLYDTTTVIRTSTLYGFSKSKNSKLNFIDKIIEESKMYNNVKVAYNKIVSSTYTEDLSKAVLKLIKYPNKDYGIYHLVNEGYCSLYDLTKETFKILNIDTKLISSKHEELYNEIKRPLFSALENKKAKEIGITLPHWKDAIQRYLQTKYII